MLPTLSKSEYSNLHRCVEEFIDLMDEATVYELCKGGYKKDIDKVFDVIMEETNNVLNLQSAGLNTQELNYLPAVKSGYEEYLRKTNLIYFVVSCLPEFELNWHNLEWFNMIQLYPRLCILAARDHSKSYSFSFAHILWRLYRYERPTALITPPKDILLSKEGMLITNEYRLAKRLLKKVKREAEDNPALQERMFPGKNVEGWANESLMCKNGSEITLSSYRTSNRGPHPSYIVLDDFLDRSTLYSKEARSKFSEVFWGEIMSMIIPGGGVYVVGTPFTKDDLYSEIKKDATFRCFEYPAIFPDGKILWEDRYNFEALLRKRMSLGNLVFSREILVRPIDDSISIFPWAILEKSFIGMQTFKMVKNRQSYAVKMKKICIGVDLALSAEASADYFVATVVGCDTLDCFHVMAMERYKGIRHAQQVSVIQRLNADFEPELIVIECNGYQKVLADLCREAGINNVLDFQTNGFNKKDYMEGLPSLAVMFENGIIRMPRGDEESIEKSNTICTEFNSVVFDSDRHTLESAGDHDDTCMSLFFAIKGIKTVTSSFSVSMIDTQPPVIPYA
jgi:hypothetical protein